jgi:hypothetical protein
MEGRYDNEENAASSSSSSPLDATSSLPPTFLKNPKNRHISRSAAKRESVQLLGSIKDLQLHFSRAGLVEHRLGAGVGVKGVLGGIQEGIGSNAGEGSENRPPGRFGYVSKGSSRARERKPWKDIEMPRIDPLIERRLGVFYRKSERSGVLHCQTPLAPLRCLTQPQEGQYKWRISIHERHLLLQLKLYGVSGL